MFVQALVDTAVYNKDWKLTPVKKGSLVQTTFSSYKQYCTGVNSKSIKPVSHKFDQFGIRKVFICEAIYEFSIQYNGTIVTFKKWDQLFLNEIETDRYTRRQWIEVTYHKELVQEFDNTNIEPVPEKPKALDDHTTEQKKNIQSTKKKK